MILSWLSKYMLFILGWEFIDNETYSELASNDKLILTFSHTSYFDFYIFLLYLLSEPQNSHTIHVLVKPQPFRYMGWLLTKLGAIPSTKLEDKNGGSVKRISDVLNKSNKFLFLIAPKGTIKHAPWRSGYYHIAKHTNAKIMSIGLDYYKKSILISSDAISPNTINEPDATKYLQDSIKKIIPLYPEREGINIHYKPTAINYPKFIFYITLQLLAVFSIKSLLSITVHSS
jgi:1-acyl-sn-glycerol-3-phosphate acyltransferase